MAERGIKGQSGKLSDSVIMSSDMEYDLYCDICSEDGKHLEAEGFCVDCSDYLCRNCYKGHRSNRACRSHVLQDKTQMPREKPDSSVRMPSARTSTEKCASHPNRLIEYYCRDDKTLGCSVCMTMIHRLCNSVDHIPELAEQLLDSQEYKQFNIMLSSLKTKSHDIIKNTQQNVVKADKWLNDAAKTLQELRKKMNDAFDKYEREIMNKAETLNATDAKQMKDIADKGNIVFNEVEKISADLQSLQNKNQLCQLFIQMIKLEDKVEALHILLTETDSDNSVTAYTFEPGSLVQEILDDQTAIGKLTVQATAGHSSSSTAQAALQKPPLEQAFTDNPASISIVSAQASARQISSSNTTKTILQKTHSAHSSAAQSTTGTADIDPYNIKAVFIRDINIKTDSSLRFMSCWITGSALLSDNKLILTDYWKCSVKLLNLHLSEVTSELVTSSQPWDITIITEDQVAATLRDARKIVFVKVTDCLTQEREMAVGGRCTAIIHNNGKMIVAFTEPKKIEIMTLDGTIEHTIDGSELFKSPSHMALSVIGNEIYVSDKENDCVIKMTLNGAIKTVYRDSYLKYSRGITVDQHGRVFVCCGIGNIHLLTPDLTKVKVLIDGIGFPKSLSYCHNSGRLFVGSTSNHVKVYQLQ